MREGFQGEEMRGCARNPALAQTLSHLRDTRMGEMLRWQEDHPQRERIQEAIFQAIGELPERLQRVIVGRYGKEGLALQQIADQDRRIQSRERVRQLEAQAIKRLRHLLLTKHELLPWQLAEPLEIVPIPGGPLDPDWVSTREAAELTGYSLDHVRKLAREGRVESRLNEFNQRTILINRASLKAYVLGGNWRRQGEWKGDDEPEG